MEEEGRRMSFRSQNKNEHQVGKKDSEGSRHSVHTRWRWWWRFLDDGTSQEALLPDNKISSLHFWLTKLNVGVIKDWVLFDNGVKVKKKKNLWRRVKHKKNRKAFSMNSMHYNNDFQMHTHPNRAYCWSTILYTFHTLYFNIT